MHPPKRGAHDSGFRFQAAITSKEGLDHVDPSKPGSDAKVVNGSAAPDQHRYGLLVAPVKGLFKRRPLAIAIDGSTRVEQRLRRRGIADGGSGNERAVDFGSSLDEDSNHLDLVCLVLCVQNRTLQ